MRDEVAMLGRSRRVGQVIELCQEPLEIHPLRTDADIELIVAVGVG